MGSIALISVILGVSLVGVSAVAMTVTLIMGHICFDGGWMRRFQLVRKEDVSGISGVGVVAEGVEFANGEVAMCWLGTYRIIENAANIHTIEHIHGHGGKTLVNWLDTED